MRDLVGIIRREVERALRQERLAFRGVQRAYRHRAPEPMLADFNGLVGEELRATEIMQQAGFVSGIPEGARLICLPIGGKTLHTVIIASEHGAYRLDVSPGEVALYNTLEPNHHVHLAQGRVVKVRCDRLEVIADTSVSFATPQFTVTASSQATFNTPTLAATALMSVGGNVTFDGGKSLMALRAAHNTHRHPPEAPATPDQTA